MLRLLAGNGGHRAALLLLSRGEQHRCYEPEYERARREHAGAVRVGRTTDDGCGAEHQERLHPASDTGAQTKYLRHSMKQAKPAAALSAPLALELSKAESKYCVFLMISDLIFQSARIFGAHGRPRPKISR